MSDGGPSFSLCDPVPQSRAPESGLHWDYAMGARGPW